MGQILTSDIKHHNSSITCNNRSLAKKSCKDLCQEIRKIKKEEAETNKRNSDEIQSVGTKKFKSASNKMMLINSARQRTNKKQSAIRMQEESIPHVLDGMKLKRKPSLAAKWMNKVQASKLNFLPRQILSSDEESLDGSEDSHHTYTIKKYWNPTKVINERHLTSL